MSAPLFNAMVTRVLTKREISEDPKAQKSLLDEVTKARDKITWIEEKVAEAGRVRNEANRSGTIAHFANSFGIASVKGDELPDDHPEHKHKGRLCLQGNLVKDQNNNAAIFQELSSSPAGIEAVKLIIMFGLLPGHIIEQSDAEQAYLQADISGGDTKTWVRLPKEYWPPAGSGNTGTQFAPCVWLCVDTRIQADIGSGGATRLSTRRASRTLTAGRRCSSMQLGMLHFWSMWTTL